MPKSNYTCYDNHNAEQRLLQKYYMNYVIGFFPPYKSSKGSIFIILKIWGSYLLMYNECKSSINK